MPNPHLKKNKPDLRLQSNTVQQLAPDDPSHIALLSEEFSENEILIFRYRLRGLKQETIAQSMGLSQPYVSQVLKKIKNYHAARGVDVDEAVIIGETRSFFELIEEKAWGLLAQAEAQKDSTLDDKRKSITLLMDARKNYIKMMQDLGMIKRTDVPIANQQNNLTINTPFVQKLQEKGAVQAVAQQLIDMTLDTLEEPQPPEEEENEEEYIETNQD